MIVLLDKVSAQIIGLTVLAVMALYPDYPWKPWLFKKTSRKFWDNSENVVSFLSWLGEQCGVLTLDDWYNVSR